MKIFWLGKFDGKEWRAEYPLVKGVRNAGGTVTERNYCNIYDDWVNDANRHDIILIQNGKQFPHWLLSRIERPIVFFASEAHWMHAGGLIEQARKNLQGVIAHSEQVFNKVLRRYRNVHLTRIHNGYDQNVYKCLQAHPRSLYDVCFIGCASSRRKPYLDAVAAYYNSTIIAECYGNSANALYNQSRVALHIHAIDQTYLPTRLFEVMPTNAFFVCEDIGNNWDGSFGLEGIRFFRGVKGCLEAIRQVLENDTYRVEGVDKRKSNSNKHTWDERGKEFLNFITEVYENPVEIVTTDIDQCYKNAKYF